MITIYTEGAVPAETAARLDRFTSQNLASIQAGLAAAMAAGRGAGEASLSTPSTTPP